MIQVPAARTYGRSWRPCQRSLMPRLSARSLPPIGRRGAPTSRAQRTPERYCSSPLASATASRRSVGSLPRSIQCEPPGRVRWLCPSTIPGTIVAPPASTISQSAGSSTLVVRGPDPGDPALGDQHADAEPEPVRAGVGERRVAVEDGAHAGVTTNWRRYRSRNVTGPRGPGTASMLIPVSGTENSLKPSSRRVVEFQNAPVPA